MASEQAATDAIAAPSEATPEPGPKSGRGLSSRWLLLIGGVIVLNIVALMLFPPFPHGGQPGDAVRLPDLLHREHARVPGPASRSPRAGSPRPRPW